MKAVVKTVEPAEREARFDTIRPLYQEALTLVERLHRRLLDVIKDEFDRRGRSDINSVQALLLYNIGDKELTAGELRTRGYYLGSNVSYNLKKLVEMEFLDHQRSRVDRRSVRIKLTAKGQEVRDIVDTLYQAFKQASTEPKVTEYLAKFIQVPWDKNPAEFRAFAEKYYGEVKPLLIKAGLAKP